MAAPTIGSDAAIRALQDRIDITDVLYRYASTIDRFDHAGLRSVLADDAWAQRSRPRRRRRVDRRSRSVLVYHTSHQVFADEPDTAKFTGSRARAG